MYSLHKLTKSDITDEYVSWLNDLETNRYLWSEPNQTKEGVIAYWKSQQKPNIYFFAICFDEKHIGNVRLEIDDRQIGELGILIGDKTHWGEGCMFEIYSYLINFAFEHFAEKVTFGCDRRNIPVIITAQKLGMYLEREYKKYCKGGMVDCVRYSLNRDTLLMDLRESFKQALELTNKELWAITNNSSIQDIPKWDSMGHLFLMAQIEKAFGIKFNDNEIRELTSIKKIRDRLQVNT